MIQFISLFVIAFLSFPIISASQEATRYFPLVQGNTWVYYHEHVVEEGIAIKLAVQEETVVTADTVTVKVNGTISALGNTYAILELNGELWRRYRMEGNYLYALNQKGGSGDYYEGWVYDFTPSDSEDPYNMRPDSFYSPRTVETMSLPYGDMTGYLCANGNGSIHEGSSMFFVDSVGPAYFDNFNGWLIPPVWDSYSLISYDVQQAPIAVEENNLQSFILFSATPNPFNPVTTLSYYLPHDKNVKVDIFNVQGQVVDTLVDEYQPVGRHSVTWNARGFSSGLYLYRVESDDEILTGKMLFLK